MRTTAIIATVLLSASLVAGCGSSDKSPEKSAAKSSDKATSGTTAGSGGGDYCDELKAAKADFDTFNSSSPDFTKFDDAIAAFHELAGDAPPAVAADWKTLDAALTGMEKALADAGLKIEDLGTILAGKLPPGMTTAQVQAIGPKLQAAFSGLETPDVQKAGDAIEKHAKSECGVELSK